MINFSVSEDYIDGINFFKVEGEIDILTAGFLEDKLNINKIKKDVVLDFQKVFFMDSSGLIVLNQLKELTNGKIIIVTQNSNIKRLLHIVGFEQFITICDSLNEAKKIIRE